MRGVGIILSLVAVLLAASAAASGTAATRPTLRVVDRTPVVIRGTGFAPAERVTVVVAAGSRWSRRVTATDGTFVARFNVVLGRCARYSVQAFGSTGTRARLVPRLALACIPGDGLIRTN
jgi:hypothetical protein